ncbi:MAG: hypothetical protein KDC84_00180 [Crocinitomicaceae bacterium]|nr:hypothetical protein [Crocinitomicaceae bacterium]
MLKHLCLILLFIPYGLSGQKHWLGFQGGYQFNRAVSWIVHGENGSYQPFHSFNFGISYRFDFHKYLFATGKVCFSKEGFNTIRSTFHRKNETLGIYKYIHADVGYRLDFISLPLIIGVRYGKKFYFTMEAGIVPQFLLKSKTIADYYVSDGFSRTIYNTYKESTKVYLQCQFGLGLALNVSSNMTIILLSNYFRGFFRYKNKQDFEGYGMWHNPNAHIPDGYSISLQFLFNLHPIKPELKHPDRNK